LRVIASPDGRDGSVTVHANAVVYVGVFGTGDAAELVLSKKHAWVHVATGAARVHGQELREGDGASFTNEERVRIEGNSPEGEVLVFDLPE